MEDCLNSIRFILRSSVLVPSLCKIWDIYKLLKDVLKSTIPFTVFPDLSELFYDMGSMCVEVAYEITSVWIKSQQKYVSFQFRHPGQGHTENDAAFRVPVNNV